MIMLIQSSILVRLLLLKLILDVVLHISKDTDTNPVCASPKVPETGFVYVVFCKVIGRSETKRLHRSSV